MLSLRELFTLWISQEQAILCDSLILGSEAKVITFSKQIFTSRRNFAKNLTFHIQTDFFSFFAK